MNPDGAGPCKALGVFYPGHNGLPLKGFKQIMMLFDRLGFNVEDELDVTTMKTEVS